MEYMWADDIGIIHSSEAWKRGWLHLPHVPCIWLDGLLLFLAVRVPSTPPSNGGSKLAL